MLALMNMVKPAFSDVDNERFKSILTVSGISEERSEDLEDKRRSLKLLGIKECPHLTPEGILALVGYCQCLRELSLSYSLLSDELLTALSSQDDLVLETFRVEAQSGKKPLPKISEKVWYNFSNRLPHINFELLSYMTEEADFDSVFTPHLPVTHLYFGESLSEAIAARIGREYQRLIELVIATYGPGTIDEILLSVARGCPSLTSVGLGDCEVTCSKLIEFVTLCAKRLRILYVWETALMEDAEFDITELAAKVSILLGRTWVPEYIPLW
ncbi:F-box/LRR-repeat protein 21-like [Prorops nasuta]|uniref:F-box/LRR-repeat protein 21-like n=1 Tax=Prorops nasuta TaxID=863751 RepID=UPI0034CFE9AA